jgi:hypothetical protein
MSEILWLGIVFLLVGIFCFGLIKKNSILDNGCFYVGILGFGASVFFFIEIDIDFFMDSDEEIKSSSQSPIIHKESKSKHVSIPKPVYDIPLELGAYDIPTLETTYRNKQQAYNKHLADFNKAKQQVNQLEARLAQAKKNVEVKQATLEDTQSEINRLKRQLKVGYFAHFKAKVEQEKNVEGYGDAGCNQQRSIMECKEAAKLAALKDASEKGSIILLDSQTWASLNDKGEWKLTKDEIRTQLRALVIGHEVLEEGFLGKGAAYYYKIRATVKGQVPPKLQRQLLGQ